MVLCPRRAHLCAQSPARLTDLFIQGCLEIPIEVKRSVGARCDFWIKNTFLSVANRSSSPFSNVLNCSRQRAGLGGQYCKRGFENARFCSQKHLSFKAYRDTRFTFEHERPCFPNTTSSHGRSHRLSIHERCNMYQLKRTGLLLARSSEIMPEIDAEHV